MPQYLPVAEKLIKSGARCTFIFYPEAGFDQIKQDEMNRLNLPYHFLSDPTEAFKFYRDNPADWIIFGNRPQFTVQEKHHITSRFALMQHGIGPKACYYDVSEYPFDVRFVEGQQRQARLQERFPDATFVDTGYAKLDPLFDDSSPVIKLQDLGLDPAKQTILYAPTFYPSSIEHFDDQLPHWLSNYNLIIKPHYFSFTKAKYQAQRDLFNLWEGADNVYLAKVEDYNLLAFMQVSDIMLSDASSAIFEFAALNKPVVWCDFYRTRWGYRGLLKFRLKKRLDPDLLLFNQICERADSAKQVVEKVQYALQHPAHQQAERLRITDEMVGATDGQCGDRICEYLLR